jgi:hypothetical protein
MALFQATLVAALGSWLIASSLWIYPHSLAYFNELVGGPLYGSEHLLGSNLDWGQDLRYLLTWASFQSNSTSVSFENFDSTTTERICVDKFTTTRQTDQVSDRLRQEKLGLWVLNARMFTNPERRSGAARRILELGAAAWPYGVRITYTIRVISRDITRSCG